MAAMIRLISMGVFAFASACLWLCCDALALGSGTDVSQRNAAHVLARATALVHSVLPPKMRMTLDRSHLSFEIMDLPDGVAGELRNKHISISPRVLNDNELLMKTLIHEISHAYDALDQQTEEFKSKRDACQFVLPGDNPSNERVAECNRVRLVSTTVSTQEWFQDAAGFWNLEFPREAMRQRMNFLESRSPDAYEWRDPQEAFAVNMEYFLRDAEFKCRRPHMYQELVDFFDGYEPFRSYNCSATTKFAVTEEVLSNKPLSLVDVPAARVYQIHYLFAGDGAGIMSRFGHAMYRIVVCAPGRPMGPACMQDVGHHLVFSFRAAVNDLSIDGMAGLVGDYPSVLYVLPFTKVVNEYTRYELRNVTSLPLRLSRLDIKRFMERSLEFHWAYEGRYKFLSNNCAHESLRLLRFALSKHPGLQSIELNRPDTFYRSLIALNLADESVLTDRKAAADAGYLFPSHQKTLDAYLQDLARAGFIPKAGDSLSSYMRLASNDLDVMLERIKGIRDQRLKATYLAKVLVIEDFVIGRARLAAYSEVVVELHEQIKKTPEHDRSLGESFAWLNQYTEIFRSAGFLMSGVGLKGYGIPTSNEIERLLNSEFLTQSPQKVRRAEEIIRTKVDRILEKNGVARDLKMSTIFLDQVKQEFKRTNPGLNFGSQ